MGAAGDAVEVSASPFFAGVDWERWVGHGRGDAYRPGPGRAVTRRAACGVERHGAHTCQTRYTQITAAQRLINVSTSCVRINIRFYNINVHMCASMASAMASAVHSATCVDVCACLQARDAADVSNFERQFVAEDAVWAL